MPGGRGVGGTEGEEADELQMACFMALLSYLAARPEVLHVAPERKFKTHNAAAIANVQSADLTRTPLTDSGLDGSGEVIQVRFLGGEGSLFAFLFYCTGDRALLPEIELFLLLR